MRGFLMRRWFLMALAAVIISGHWLGAAAPPEVLRGIDTLFADGVKSGVIAGVLFLMSVTLDGSRLRGAIVSPAPVAWAVAVNAVLIPLTAPLLMPLQRTDDFAVGMLIVASVPSTLAAAAVWTRRAGGNDAVSLVVTIATNGACFLYTPFWLRLFAGASVEFDVRGMMQRLFLTTLLPTLCGQLCRRCSSCAERADRWKTPLGVLAQMGVLTIVFSAACEAGRRMAFDPATAHGGHAPPGVAAWSVMIASCIGLHLAAMLTALGGARLARFDRGDQIAIAFAASQKTLPIGVLIATDPRTFGTAFPWAVYPILIFHAFQLFLDTAVADRFRRQGEPLAAVPAPPQNEYDLNPET
jgi:sodium/bile acid cotransporter 7